jgi:hypothetical protein
MEPQAKSNAAQPNRSRTALWWFAAILTGLLLCTGLTAPHGLQPARAQGSTPTYTPPTPYQCMYIQYAYVTETTVVVGVNNNTGSTTRFRTATLDWPSDLGGSGGDYVDYFQWNGNQFYNGNDTSPPTSASATNNATYQITPGQTLDFIAAFGLIPLNRPLYGTFSVTLLFRNGCSVSIDVSREPDPSDCPTVTNSYINGTNLYYVVYNNLGVDTNFEGADLDWPDIPSPNRYVNYFRWGTDQFYPGNDNDPPTSANDSTPDLFSAGSTSFFRVNFGNAGTLTGAFTVTLRFSYPCSTTYTHWQGVTPTTTATPTQMTPTATEIPLSGSSSAAYSAMLLNAPDFGLAAQTIRGSVQGGTPPYSVMFSIEDPDGNIETYGKSVSSEGAFELTPAESNPYLGCSKEGVWDAWFEIEDALGGNATSNTISWTVNFPRVHGIP